jgi:cytidylate kinase
LKPVVAIDGPSGSGKSTVARLLSKRLGYTHLDTGAMYRAVALAAMRSHIPLNDNKALDDLCSRIGIELVAVRGVGRILLNGEDVTEEIRLPELSMGSSAVSAVPEVRRHMVRLQREIGSRGAVVAEGRDMGTVVFHDTRAKFFLDAAPQERARRRWLQLQEGGVKVDMGKVLNELLQRDKNDESREHSPLKKAEDAVFVDTTDKTAEEVTDILAEKVLELEGRDV